MYSYLHRYHAGCFADIHKHLTLIALLIHLQKKSTPFCVIDTHAGEGFYDLLCEQSQKNKEYLNGLDPLLTMQNPPSLVENLFKIIQSYQIPGFYPGSPSIIQSFLRAQDSAICIEGHGQTFANLQRNLGKDKRIHLHQRDALEAMKALIPFKEKRGLIFLDPSYEVKTDYENIAHAIMNTYSRFSHGIFALWYPLLPQKYHEKMIELIQASSLKQIWQCEWIPYPNKSEGMLGSGMIIINPPWQIDSLLKDTFALLNITVYPNGHFSNNWLNQA